MSIHPESIVIWPDDTMCYWSEINSYTHMSDDYRVIHYPVGAYNNVAQTAYYMHFWSAHEDCLSDPLNWTSDVQLSDFVGDLA